MRKHDYGVALYPPPEVGGFTATEDKDNGDHSIFILFAKIKKDLGMVYLMIGLVIGIMSLVVTVLFLLVAAFAKDDIQRRHKSLKIAGICFLLTITAPMIGGAICDATFHFGSENG